MRISDWAQKFNLAVKRCEERPDQPQGDIVYRVKDIFTTLLRILGSLVRLRRNSPVGARCLSQALGRRGLFRRRRRRPQFVCPGARPGWQAGEDREADSLLVGWVRQAGRSGLHRLRADDAQTGFRLGQESTSGTTSAPKEANRARGPGAPKARPMSSWAAGCPTNITFPPSSSGRPNAVRLCSRPTPPPTPTPTPSPDPGGTPPGPPSPSPRNALSPGRKSR